MNNLTILRVILKEKIVRHIIHALNVSQIKKKNASDDITITFVLDEQWESQKFSLI